MQLGRQAGLMAGTSALSQTGLLHKTLALTPLQLPLDTMTESSLFPSLSFTLFFHICSPLA